MRPARLTATKERLAEVIDELVEGKLREALASSICGTRNYVDGRTYVGLDCPYHRTVFWLSSVTESVVLPPERTGVHHMSASPSRAEPSLLPIERPRCPKCQGRMMLAHIEAGPSHSDLRTFECPKCKHIHKVIVEDPIKLGNVWIESGLNAPR